MIRFRKDTVAATIGTKKSRIFDSDAKYSIGFFIIGESNGKEY